MRVVTSPTERRRRARVAVRLPAVLTSGGGRAAGDVVDLSLSGCRVAADARVMPGERLRVALDLGGDGGGMVACEAIVARVPARVWSRSPSVGSRVTAKPDSPRS